MNFMNKEMCYSEDAKAINKENDESLRDVVDCFGLKLVVVEVASKDVLK